MLDQLTSRSTLYAAFDRVRENSGCRGSDGVSIADFHDHLEVEIDHLQDRLIRRRYHPLPLLRFQVPVVSPGRKHENLRRRKGRAEILKDQKDQKDQRDKKASISALLCCPLCP
jgi:hypothetical protein